MNIAAIEVPMDKISEFCDRCQVTEIALFGSVLRDDFRPDGMLSKRKSASKF
jgi:uncharacterized protein